ncbi:MAG: O-methyltransferase [Candidatus Poribacteria bacterium]|nr:O-methyltransferase [Candidatus Poribacteria bacterium]
MSKFCVKYEQTLKRLEKTAKQYTNIAPENGQFLYILIRSIQAQNVLEVGTSNGYSAIWLAAALKETKGRLITLEFDPIRAEEAHAHLVEVGLEEIVEIRVGNALDEIHKCDTTFDLVFLDAEKDEYLRYLELVLPNIRKGGLVVADDTVTMRDEMLDYVDFVFNTPLLNSVDIPLDDGIILSYKTD